MKIWHRGHLPVEQKQFLVESGIRFWPYLKDPTAPYSEVQDWMFVISEDHPAWPEVARLMGGEHRYYISTEFTKEEIAAAEWSIVRTRHSVHSLRSVEFGWSPEYFADLCAKCGSGWRQIAPFKLKREPKLGKSVFSSFGSGFEVFAAPVVWEAFRREGVRGWETRPLFIARTGEPVKGLQQLVVTEMAEPAVVEELCERQRYSRNECEACGRTWHAHYTRGMLPLRRAALRTDVDLQLTHEWFGNGLTARHEILASRKVVALALRERWRGIEFVPVRVV